MQICRIVLSRWFFAQPSSRSQMRIPSPDFVCVTSLWVFIRNIFMVRLFFPNLKEHPFWAGENVFFFPVFRSGIVTPLCHRSPIILNGFTSCKFITPWKTINSVVVRGVKMRKIFEIKCNIKQFSPFTLGGNIFEFWFYSSLSRFPRWCKTVSA